jgi:hypothetical protein
LRRFFTVLAALVGLFMVTSSANAQTALQTWTFDATNQNPEYGSWNVILSRYEDNVWGVKVRSNMNMPVDFDHHGHRVGLAFFSDMRGWVTPHAATTWGSGEVQNIDGSAIAGGAWVPSPYPALEPATWINDSGTADELRNTGENQFVGYYKVNSAGPVRSVRINVKNGNVGWEALQVVPETNAVAQFLPALLPVGLALRRGGLRGIRRKNAA